MKKILSVLLCVALVLSAFCTLSFAEGKPYYVVLGDSIAYGSGLINSRSAVYGKIVADTNGYDYDNFAIPGHTTKNLLSRLNNENVSEAVAAADIIGISIGGNNFLTDNLPGLVYDSIVREDYSKFDGIAETFYTDLVEIYNTIRGLNSDGVIVLQTIYNPQSGYVGEVYQQGADRINSKIVKFGEEKPGEVIVVDVASALNSPSDFAKDGIHPSVAGNEKIARAVLASLSENGLGSETEPVINTKGIDVRGTYFMTLFMRLYGQMLHIISVIRGRIFNFG